MVLPLSYRCVPPLSFNRFTAEIATGQWAYGGRSGLAFAEADAGMPEPGRPALLI
jgi:hypothetical protein